ncbi:glycerol kinase GlpK [Histidinibacterium lentulum]|uniref:Glycerol kinase n=1 Tax=Histidinibacterium lentulum TaxID=2480588 RepID=A0A3N2R7P0_9RHOB|nr:glycerol kinase GlpK [Histidinibacterium lentulum]ROU03418.1 glycerol kinase [Histidinibacterium lentulum]
MGYILALDQGTTSSRGIVFDGSMRIVAVAQEEFPQHYPASGWVEHDPSDLWATTAATARSAIEKAGLHASDIAAIGITNQRETALVWDRKTGKPIHNAIVWQDRRTAGFCAQLREDGQEAMITERTGLLADPYFSSTKVKWLLDNVEGARERARRGELAFGTVDSWLIWNLTGGRAHVTDATNAARTMLYDIHKGRWSRTICDLFDIPVEMLPEVRDCAAEFGMTRADLFGREIPILGVAGDQQAATLGQACFEPGMVKSTYGTGCFAVLNTGDAPVASTNKLLTTIAYQLGGRPTYALEGSIFIAGAVVQWLRDGLKVIRAAPETQGLAESADPAQDLVLVPAFVGLGAPYWKPEARGAVFGMTRNSGPAEFARAALESVGYQTRDLLEAMQADWAREGAQPSLRVDGGMAANDYAMQFLSDIIGAPVDRPEVLETTALGAAWLAGTQAGVWPGRDEFAKTWAMERQFTPGMDEGARDARYGRWKRAVTAVLGV